MLHTKRGTFAKGNGPLFLFYDKWIDNWIPLVGGRYVAMIRKARKTWKTLFAIWCLWSGMLAGYAVVCQQIPTNMYLYEEDAMEVLSGNSKKINPEKLNIDFAGDIHIAQSKNGSYEAMFRFLGMIPVKTMELEVVQKQEVLPGGIPVGIYVETDGIFVIGTGDIETEHGSIESPAKNILKTGDYIVSFQGERISEKRELVERLREFQGEELVLGIRRKQEELKVSVHPYYEHGVCCIGVWVRDDTQGVGTLTYLTLDGKFAALGHGISDSDSEILMEVSEGKLYDCEIVGITKGEKGIPGRLAGKINYRKNNIFGDVRGNLSGGIYGTANQSLKSELNNAPMPVGLKQEIKTGKASIRCSVDGEVEEYEIRITKVNKGEKNINKGMEIKIVDSKLLELTGGIVQGMSGSPIIQDGKLVGAVTHVLVNDPTRGYGIFIENMLEAAE